PRREVVLLHELRVVGDVHLPVVPEALAAGSEDPRAVVIQALRPFFEVRDQESDAELSRYVRHLTAQRSVGHLGELERRGVFGLAKVRPSEQLLKTNQRGPARRSVADAV